MPEEKARSDTAAVRGDFIASAIARKVPIRFFGAAAAGGAVAGGSCEDGAPVDGTTE
jgi:hypothetical protein